MVGPSVTESHPDMANAPVVASGAFAGGVQVVAPSPASGAPAALSARGANCILVRAATGGNGNAVVTGRT